MGSAGGSVARSKSVTRPGEILAGFEFIAPFLRNFSQTITPQFGDIFAGETEGAQNALGTFGQLLSQFGGATPGTLDSFREGQQTGFAPDVIEGLEAALLPALERSKARTEAGIRESAGLTGVLRSTGTNANVADAFQGLESGVLATLGQAGAQSELQGQQIRGQLANPNILAAALTPLIAPILQSSQFGQQLPLQALGALSGGVGAVPFSQRSRSKSKSDSAQVSILS